MAGNRQAPEPSRPNDLSNPTNAQRPGEITAETTHYRGDKRVTGSRHYAERGYHLFLVGAYELAVHIERWTKDGTEYQRTWLWGKPTLYRAGERFDPAGHIMANTNAGSASRTWATLDRGYGRGAAIDAARQWLDAYRAGERRGLLITGEPGRGKSLIADLIVRDLANEAVLAVRCPWTDPVDRLGLVQAHQDIHNDAEGTTAKAKLRRYGAAPVLVLDDLGKSTRSTSGDLTLTPAQQELLHATLEASISHRRPIVATANWAPEAFRAIPDHGAIASRLSTFLHVHLGGPDFRTRTQLLP